jgi:hypothetical protein
MEDLTVPFLTKGVGETPARGGCIMQLADWISTGGWGDSPTCVSPPFRTLAVKANDSLNRTPRQGLLDDLGRLTKTRARMKALSKEESYDVIACMVEALPVPDECNCKDLQGLDCRSEAADGKEILRAMRIGLDYLDERFADEEDEPVDLEVVAASLKGQLVER